MRFFIQMVCTGVLASSPAAIARPPIPPTEQTIPAVSKISLSNAVGVLNYCKENAIIDDDSVGSLVDELSKRADRTSEDYIVGSSGQILGDAAKNFSIFRAPADQRSQACVLILQRTKLFAH